MLHYKTKILTYCLKCKKHTKNIHAKMMKTINGRLVLSSKCGICASKKIIKEQEAKGLLSSLGIRTPLSKIPGFNILF